MSPDTDTNQHYLPPREVYKLGRKDCVTLAGILARYGKQGRYMYLGIIVDQIYTCGAATGSTFKIVARTS
jgi:hypothetical protein